mmetsp:Transcript_4413/g.28150  ORF Transcript_4413/g.28150 Transcript_4413/m.28150 type:complete len:119 (-) Transcript_4413:649-1005(-)
MTLPHFLPQNWTNLRPNIARSWGRLGQTRGREGTQTQQVLFCYYALPYAPYLNGEATPKCSFSYCVCRSSLTVDALIAVEIVYEAKDVGGSRVNSPQRWNLVKGCPYQQRSSHLSAQL